MVASESAININAFRISNELFFEQIIPYLAKGQSVKISVAGNSMNPFLVHGDKITLMPIQDQDLKIGRIILAKSSGIYILHRIVKLSDNDIYLAGDGNLAQIEKIKKNEIMAIAYYVERNEKQIYLYSKGKLCLAKLWFFARPFRIILNSLLRKSVKR
ncbi:S24/S26 family peptidase [Sphingobacterium sp. HJSM2_6]|uniref:S24/S26 family peptidase n=1 Tax=Sphingobacterium sp. HJSM2_6 TaxID=3366264 RepID=UPI003BD34261